MFVTVSYSLQIRLLIRKYPDLSLKAFFFFALNLMGQLISTMLPKLWDSRIFASW